MTKTATSPESVLSVPIRIPSQPFSSDIVSCEPIQNPMRLFTLSTASLGEHGMTRSMKIASNCESSRPLQENQPSWKKRRPSKARMALFSLATTKSLTNEFQKTNNVEHEANEVIKIDTNGPATMTKVISLRHQKGPLTFRGTRWRPCVLPVHVESNPKRWDHSCPMSCPTWECPTPNVSWTCQSHLQQWSPFVTVHRKKKRAILSHNCLIPNSIRILPEKASSKGPYEAACLWVCGDTRIAIDVLRQRGVCLF